MAKGTTNETVKMDIDSVKEKASPLMRGNKPRRQSFATIEATGDTEVAREVEGRPR